MCESSHTIKIFVIYLGTTTFLQRDSVGFDHIESFAWYRHEQASLPPPFPFFVCNILQSRFKCLDSEHLWGKENKICILGFEVFLWYKWTKLYILCIYCSLVYPEVNLEMCILPSYMHCLHSFFYLHFQIPSSPLFHLFPWAFPSALSFPTICKSSLLYRPFHLPFLHMFSFPTIPPTSSFPF